MRRAAAELSGAPPRCPGADGLTCSCSIANGPPLLSRFPRSETYQYYNLPFCQPTDGKEYKLEFLGEVLEGDRLVTTPYSIKFRSDVDNANLCGKKLTSDDLKKFREAVKQDYYFQVRIQAGMNTNAPRNTGSCAAACKQGCAPLPASAMLHLCEWKCNGAIANFLFLWRLAHPCLRGAALCPYTDVLR